MEPATRMGAQTLALELRFDRPTSVFLGGTSRPLLNWCALGLARKADPNFWWTDVRLPGEELDPMDPLARSTVPKARLHIAGPASLPRDERSAEIARAHSDEVISTRDGSDSRRRLVEFMGLPVHTQELLPAETAGKGPRCLVLSNAHRMIALYPTAKVEPTVRAITEMGATLILTFADASPEGRWAFDTVLEVEGGDPPRWRDATVRIEKLHGSIHAKTPEKVSLRDLAPAAATLGREFPEP